MSDAYGRTAEFALVLGIAEALRQELGDQIDAHPGLHDPADAGQVNRAFCAVARHILRTIAVSEEGRAQLLTAILVQIARHRLAAHGLDEPQIEFLLAQEPAGRDDWSAFLILMPWEEIPLLLEADESSDNNPSEPT
jgi:hypothetical protein